MTHSFSVDLSGLIDLLSEHLYGGPEVFLRELMQNGVDAIRAREGLTGTSGGALDFALSRSSDGTPVLTFRDDGVGLTEPEVHSFLATIGRSSKRGDASFIGQFGIGLLSCFVVSDRIELLSRSARGGAGVHWVGLADGTYTLELLADDPDARAGTTITLHAKPGREDFFDFEAVLRWVSEYGALLPYPVTVHDPAHHAVANEGGAPWRDHYPSPERRRDALMAYGEALLGAPPLDVLDLHAGTGEVDGVAFVLPWTPSQRARGHHRVYLRNMLIGDERSGLIPDWAFFVRAVLNTGTLRPNAARDALHEDADLHAASRELAGALRAYLTDLQTQHPERLRRLIGLHYLSIKALAVEDQDFFELFMPWLPFETSFGRMTLPEYLARTPEVRYVSDLNVFRQVAQLEGALGRGVVHAVYTYDEALLTRYGALHPETPVERLDAAGLSRDLGRPEPGDLQAARTLQDVAREVLAPFEVSVRISDFRPAELASLFLPHDDFARTVRRTQETLGEGLWADLLGDLNPEQRQSSELHLNYASVLVRRAAGLPDGPVLRRVIGMLYVQALLLGQHPLGARELELLNGGMLELIHWTLDSQTTSSLLN